MKFVSALLLIICSVGCMAEALPRDPSMLQKVFNYQGAMPIKEELSKTNSSGKEVGDLDQSEAEAACWKLITEQSAVTFALQRRVLDELQKDMVGLKMDKPLESAVKGITDRLRGNMDEAEDALKRDSADEFFDALFDTSEDIIAMSTLLRDPKLDDQVFLTLVKAVSRLGRNNTSLIQDFTDMCSFARRSTRPRVASS